MPWSEVLERALDEAASPEHEERRRLGEPEADHLDVRHVIYALRLAAGRRETKSLTPDEYEVAALDAPRPAPPRRTPTRLPAVGSRHSSLRRGERDASLEGTVQGVSEARRRQGGDAVGRMDGGAEGDDPVPGRPRADGADRGATDREAARWSVEAGHGPRGRIPSAAPGVKRGKNKYAEADCITAVRRCLEEDQGPHNQKGYLLFAGQAPRAGSRMPLSETNQSYNRFAL